MNRILLSICIPTYNRADTIGDALESIIKQATDEVEIVVNDNASTDNTKEIIDKYHVKFPRLHYYRWSENVGPDRNFYDIIKKSSGEYCWLLSSDDILEPNSISTILKEIKDSSNIDVFVVKANAYSKDLKKIIPAPDPFITCSKGKYKGDTVFTDSTECMSVMTTLVGFISALVVKKDSWVAVESVERYMESIYIHIYIIGSIIKRGGILKYISTPLIGWRSDNDSFLDTGIYKRLEIDVKAYHSIIADVFGFNSAVNRRVNSNVIRGYVFWRIRAAKAQGMGVKALIKCFKLCFNYYHSYLIFWLKVFPVFITPSFLWVISRKIYRKTWKEFKSKKVGLENGY